MVWHSMKKSLKKIMIVSIFILAVFTSEGNCQEFITSPFITTPGDNLEFDVLPVDGWNARNSPSFICWINKLDSVYTVYLKQLSPIVGDAMVVASDTRFKSRPQITATTIGWQSMHDNLWQISLRNYTSAQLTPSVLILDSLAGDPEFTLSNYRIAWIQNNNLFEKSYYPNQGSPFLVDSSGCSSPRIPKQDNTTYNEILYEKVVNGHQRIAMAQFNYYAALQWSYSLLSGDSARNPNFGIDGGISFESMKNQISRIQYSMYGPSLFMTTTNQTCNYRNPSVFSYPLTTGLSTTTTPFFVVFDSDSLPGNNEIFMKTIFNGDTIINISQSEGFDAEPRVSYIFSNDTVFVAVLWKHTQFGKTDIWMARTPFNPIISGVEKEEKQVSSFRLLQNYPNPFNPSTVLSYKLPISSLVTIKVYDVLGREVQTLVDERQNAGNHSVTFSASNLPSGVYFYRLQAGNYSATKKLLLLK